MFGVFENTLRLDGYFPAWETCACSLPCDNLKPTYSNHMRVLNRMSVFSTAAGCGIGKEDNLLEDLSKQKHTAHHPFVTFFHFFLVFFNKEW